MDSFYEYLIKMYLYDPKEFSFYKDRWVAAAESTIKYLASHPTTRKDLTFIGGYQGTKIFPNSGHCKCWSGRHRQEARALSLLPSPIGESEGLTQDNFHY